MFRVSRTDNTENSIFIQGARARSNLADIAGIMFQNYDADTATTYNMVKISMQDHFGNETHNGAGDLVIKTNIDGTSLAEQMRVRCDGNVGIGTDSPDHKLTVSGTVACSNVMENGVLLSDKYVGGGEAQALKQAACNIIELSNVAYSAVPRAGNVTITGPISISPFSSNDVAGTSLVVTGTTITDSIITTSDTRLKTITSHTIDTGKVLDDVKHLTVCRFYFTNDAAKRERIGLLAQNVAQHMPDAVLEYDGYLRVDNTIVQAYLVAAIQRLEERVAHIEAGLGRCLETLLQNR